MKVKEAKERELTAKKDCMKLNMTCYNQTFKFSKPQNLTIMFNCPFDLFSLSHLTFIQLSKIYIMLITV